jgi:hypothetical protein
VNGRHLGGQHRLNLISWLDTLDDRERKIELLLLDFTTVCLSKLVDKASKKV